MLCSVSMPAEGEAAWKGIFLLLGAPFGRYLKFIKVGLRSHKLEKENALI